MATSTIAENLASTMARYEAKGEYDNPEYQKVVFETLYTKHLCRTSPWPEPVDRAFRKLATKFYGTMQGPNEFVITGNFKSWDRWADLPKIKVPVLLIAARHDTMSVKDKERMAKLIPNSRLVVCENGSHMAMYDDQEATSKASWASLRRWASLLRVLQEDHDRGISAAFTFALNSSTLFASTSTSARASSSSSRALPR
jgi:proline-specific peptidase